MGKDESRKFYSYSMGVITLTIAIYYIINILYENYIITQTTVNIFRIFNQIVQKKFVSGNHISFCLECGCGYHEFSKQSRIFGIFRFVFTDFMCFDNCNAPILN